MAYNRYAYNLQLPARPTFAEPSAVSSPITITPTTVTIMPAAPMITMPEAPMTTTPHLQPLIILSGPENVNEWAAQIRDDMAPQLNFADLLQEQHGASSPPDGTCRALTEKMRAEIAGRTMLRTISPAVFAYMRVLGFKMIGGYTTRSIAKLFSFAREAAESLDKVRRCGQGGVEKDLMMAEWDLLRPDRNKIPREVDVPSARAWLADMLRLQARDRPYDQELQNFVRRLDKPASGEKQTPRPSPVKGEDDDAAGRGEGGEPNDLKARELAGGRKRRADDGDVPAKREDSRMPSPPDTDREDGGRRSADRDPHEPAAKRSRATSPSTYRILKTEPGLVDR